MTIERLHQLRRQLIIGIFGVVMLWPPVQVILSKVFGFSPWRFFGWGMYAVPHPESLSQISIIWLNHETGSKNWYREVYEEYRKRSSRAPDQNCFAAFIKDGNSPLRAISTGSLCDNDGIEEDLSYLSQFRSLSHLSSLVKKVGPRDDHGHVLEAMAILTRQRLNVKESMAYTENQIFMVTPQESRFLGFFD